MGKGKKRVAAGRDAQQRQFILNCWLSGMTASEAHYHLDRHYNADAAHLFIDMLWPLRADQLAAFNKTKEGEPT